MTLRSEGPILVIGPGAIGCLIAARLAAAGSDVVVAARTEAAARQLRASGLLATDPDGATTRAEVRAIARPSDLRAPPRLAVLATKCSAALPALREWDAVLAGAPIVAVQNGVLGDALQPLLGERLLECTVAFPATLKAPGESEQTGPGGFHLGPWPEAVGDLALSREAAAVLAPAGPVAVEPNMRGVKWTKLLINSCMNTLGVATGQPFGELLADPRARSAFLAVVAEGYAAGRVDGVRFQALSGFRPRLFASRLPGRHALLRLIGRKYGRQRSSSLQSLERGQKTEVDELNGRIVATARQHGLTAPVNEALVALVHDIEAGRLLPSPGNLARLQ